jgi:hypothetical protein
LATTADERSNESRENALLLVNRDFGDGIVIFDLVMKVSK